jgi:hypothetical protein
MAKGGAFGNPLTTGIALNFEVDMTPYRQMMQDNLKFAQTQAAERKAKEKEFQDILKNITYDDSKILKRRRDGARVEYASLINDVINLNKNGDRGGVQNRIADFRSGMNNLVDEKTNFNLYEKAAREGKSWTSAEYINAMNGLNEGETSDESIIKLYPDEIDYDSKSGTFASQAIPKADAMSWANKILQGMPLKSTNLKPELVPETGEYRFPLSKVEDPEAFYKEMGALWLGGGESNVETMRREMGLTSDDLDGTGAIDNSTEYMRFLFQDKVGGDRYGRPLADKGGGFSFNVGGGKSESSIFNKSGGRELKIEGGNVLKTKGQYDITFTKGAGKTTMNVTDGSYEIDQNTGEFKKTNYSGSLSDAIPVAPIVDENGQEWYMAISQGDVADKDVNLATLLLAIRQDPDADTLSLVQKELAKAKYGKTYLIKGNDSVRNQFWQKTLGQDYTKQRAADAMKELGKSEDRLGLGI